MLVVAGLLYAAGVALYQALAGLGPAGQVVAESVVIYAAAVLLPWWSAGLSEQVAEGRLFALLPARLPAPRALLPMSLWALLLPTIWTGFGSMILTQPHDPDLFAPRPLIDIARAVGFSASIAGSLTALDRLRLSRTALSGNDEPTAALDSTSQATLARHGRSLQNIFLLILIVAHAMSAAIPFGPLVVLAGLPWAAASCHLAVVEMKTGTPYRAQAPASAAAAQGNG
ncbi:hypothetical protein [Rhodovibrio sodomensis]|nr:hypothetical protein [Rhodovibrio sodomensis]